MFFILRATSFAVKDRSGKHMGNYTCTHTAADFTSQTFAFWIPFTE
jgi:hypothetical protein